LAAELRDGCAKGGSKRLLKAVEDLRGEIDVARSMYCRLTAAQMESTAESVPRRKQV
jgi:hypothetical protein